MKVWSAFVVALFFLPASAVAQSGVSDAERAAFLQGDFEAEQAQGVGNALAAYCGGYASIINSRYYRMSLVVPVECDQFWTYVEIFGPRFWYLRAYTGVRLSFDGIYQCGSFHSYGWIRDGHDHRHFRRPPKHGLGENHARLNVHVVRTL